MSCNYNSVCMYPLKESESEGGWGRSREREGEVGEGRKRERQERGLREIEMPVIA